MTQSKICFIGNSHLGALAQAPGGNAAFAAAGYDVVYWGAAGSLFPEIVYEDGWFRSPSPKRSRVISGDRYGHLPLAEFGTIVFYGCAVTVLSVAIRIANTIPNPAGLSSAFLDAVLSEQIAAWWAVQPVRGLMQDATTHHPETTCLFTVHPHRAEDPAYLAGIADIGFVRLVRDRLLDTLEGWCRDRSILFYRQDPATLADNGLLTLGEYSTGSVEMERNTPHKGEDLVHMNSRYGELAMAGMLAILTDGGRSAKAVA